MFNLDIKKQFINSFLGKFRGAAGYWDQQLIDDAVEKNMDKSVKLFEDITGPVVDYLDKQNDFKKAIKGLPDLFKEIDTADIEQNLINILFTAELTGRLAVSEENKAEPQARSFTYYAKEASKLDLIKALTLCFDKEPEEAVQYLESKDIAVTESWRDQEELIKKHAFTVANVGSADVLQMFQDELNTSLKTGITYDTFKSTIAAILDSKGYTGKGARRLDTIYRTNMQASYMAGRWKQMNEVADDFPYWEFVAITDTRTTEGCRGLDGVILPVNASFWKTNFPPRHYMCRSRTRAISDQMLENRGLKPDDPKKYDDIEPSEGFANSPGDEWKPDLGKYSKPIRSALEDIMESFS